MELPDYKMVQGGNTRVNMSAGAASQVGKAFASMGKDLEDAGMEVSGLFEEAERQHNIGKMADLQLELDQTRSEYEQKMMSDPNGAVKWRQGWDDVMAKKQKEIDAREMSGTLRDQTNLYVKNFSGKQGISVSHTAHKALLENARDSVRAVAVDARIRDDYDTSDAHWDKAYSEGLINKAEHTEQKLLNARGREKYEEQLVYKDSMNMIDADPKGELPKIENGEGHYAYYEGDRETREKLASEARSRQAMQAREQADNLAVAMYSSTKFTSKDLEDFIEDGKLSQYSDANLAKLRAGVKSDTPVTQDEVMGAYKRITELEKQRPNMNQYEYAEAYNNLEAQIYREAKAKPWVSQYLRSINPASKDTGSAAAKSKTAAKKEATKVLVASQEMGEFLPSYTAPIEMGKFLPDFEVEPPLDTGEFKEKTLKVQEESRQKMADAEAEIFEFIENYEGELTNEIIRNKAGEVLGAQRVNRAYERINRATQPKGAQNKNRYGASTRTSGRTMRGNWQKKVNVDRSLGAANTRYNNPSAAYPRKEDEKYGIEGYGTIGGGHRIGKFPSPIHGAAANFDLFADNYTNMTFKKAMKKWRGEDSPVPNGYKDNQIIDKNFLNDSSRAIDFFKKMALHESPDFAGMTDADWMSAWEMWKANQ